MSIGSILFGAGLLWLSFTVILRPWRRKAVTGEPGGKDEEQGGVGHAMISVRGPSGGNLTERRDAIYGALADLDFDCSIGKLNDDDYQIVRSQLMAQAVEVLQQLDTSSAGIESRVEALVRERREVAPARASVARPSALFGAMNVYCSGCGSALKPDDHFCGKCGAPVTARCPHCDAAVGAADGFCIRCGTPLVAGAAA